LEGGKKRQDSEEGCSLFSKCRTLAKFTSPNEALATGTSSGSNYLKSLHVVLPAPAAQR
jgi:hypothetical protein